MGNKANFAERRTASVAINAVDIYDATTDTWSTATLSQARRDLAATTLGGKALFAGGWTGSATSNVVDIAGEVTGSAPLGLSTSVQAITVMVQPASVDFGPLPSATPKSPLRSRLPRPVPLRKTCCCRGRTPLPPSPERAAGAWSRRRRPTYIPSAPGVASAGPFTTLTTASTSLAANVAAAGTKSFFLELKLPTSTTGNGVRNTTVTVVAVTP